MSMRLTAAELSAIAYKVDEIAKINGIDVRQIKVGLHVVHLERVSDRQNGNTYFVVGISNQDKFTATRGPTDLTDR